MKRRHLVLALAAAPLLATQGQAQEPPFPSRELNLVVSYAAGGATDLTARAIARRLEKELGVPVVVKNMAGAQGTIGQDTVRRARPDGYNLAMVTSSSTALSPYLVNNVYKPTDFDYVGAVGLARFGIAVRADAPYRTLAEFVEAARKAPLFYGTSSAVTSMGFDELARKSGAKFEAVNYKSGPEIVAAVIGGQVAAAMQAPGEIMAHVQSGRLRLLASVGASRWPSAPNVPTLREAGYDMVVESWVGIAVPKGLPAPVAARLQAALARVSADAGMATDLESFGIEPNLLSGAVLGDKLQATYVAAEPLMRAVGK